MYLQRIRFGAAVQVAPIVRIPPRSSCNRMEARRTTRTKRVHPASSWHQSRTGMSQSCAPKNPSNLAHSDGKRASGWAHSRLELGAASAGRSLWTAQPASCMLVVLCMRDACTELAAAGLLLESRCRWHMCAVPPRSCDSDHDCSPEWPPRASVWWGWQTYCGVTFSSRHRGDRSSGSGCSGRFECTWCDQSGRVRRKRSARGEQGVGAGAPAPVGEGLLLCRA